MDTLADRLHAWSENDPDPDYFFGETGDVFSALQADCRDACAALRRGQPSRERIADEVTNCVVFIVEALLAAGIRSPGIPPEDICELIEPHIADTVAELLAAKAGSEKPADDAANSPTA